MSPRYRAERVEVDGQRVLRLHDDGGGVVLSTLPGVGNLAFDLRVRGVPIVHFPFTVGAFAARPELTAIPFIAPWVNRLAGDGYRVGGRRFAIDRALGNVGTDGNGLPIHGLLVTSGRWEVLACAADATAAEAVARLEFWRHPDLMAQFPFAHTLRQVHRVRDGAVEIETVIDNHAAEPMPVAVGFHPYFRIPGVPRDDWTVTVPARTRWVLDKRLLPTGAREPRDPAAAVALRGAALDDLFGDLVRGRDGWADLVLAGGGRRIAVRLGPRFTTAVAWAPPGQEFAALEPMSAPTNGFDLAADGRWDGLQTIAPAAQWREIVRIEASGFG